ncbi:hypothetical protein HZS_7394 [Henneguya salminicola]|nr:hypothetical protein HZS_7394 [Henneguya salminicola]
MGESNITQCSICLLDRIYELEPSPLGELLLIRNSQQWKQRHATDSCTRGRTKCHGKLILKKEKTEIKGVHTCASNTEIIGKIKELSKEDQNPSDFIQKHIRDNAETVEKIPENLQNSTKKES